MPIGRLNIDWLEDRGIPRGLYQITTNGKIWSTESEQFLKPQSNKGYMEVDLKFEGYRVKAKLHRLVAHAFLPPPTTEDQCEVNHIDGIRTHNYVENLEWVTRSENIQHRNNVLKSDPGGRAKKPVLLCKKKGEGMLFESHSSAITFLACSPAQFYTALSKSGILREWSIITILNPEVMGNERNQDKYEQGDVGGRTRAESEAGSESGSKVEKLPEKSFYAQGLLEKWKR